MEQSTKICAMCRKSIDKNSMLCPYCQSDVNYKYFIEISGDQVIRKRNPRLKFFSKLLFLIAAVITGLILMLFTNFWLGAILIIFIGAAVSSFVDNNSWLGGSDQVKIVCPSCGDGAEYQWTAGSLESGKTVKILCTSCKQISKLAVTS